MFSEIRDEIVARAMDGYAVAFPGIPLVLENQPFDWNNPPDVVAELEVEYHLGQQISMGASPKTRHRGFIYVMVHLREGVGTVSGLKVLDWFSSKLGNQNLGLTQVLAPQGVPNPPSRGGWGYKEMKFAFYADEP